MNTTLKRNAFTLVELLVAISIIGILMAIAIPAISRALQRGREAAIRTEVESLNQSVEAYKLKYGDYPPDFFDWNLAVRHYRKIFPDINVSELNILRDQCAVQTQVDANQPVVAHDPSRIDRAEALVWALGGFSSDPQFPFTGQGGPLTPIVPAPVPARVSHYNNFAYNGTKDNALFDFDASLLTIGEYDLTALTALSTEEAAGFGDRFPAYLRGAGGSPYLYFDSRTYGSATPAGVVNHYNSPPTQEWGRARPYLSSQVVGPTESIVRTTAPAGGPGLAFMNKNTFQLLSAGLDDTFGLVTGLPHSAADPNSGAPVYFAYPDGGIWQIDTSVPVPAGESRLFISSVGTKYAESELSGVNGSDNFYLDNFASFAPGTLDSELP
jgi:prepilin-type N-terminal cleavage/methylation domain-containing protein